jgi:hypothetical protein
MPEVNIRELSTQEDGDGETYLKIEALHATKLVFETGDNDPTISSSPVPTPAKFEAKGLRYRFLAVDPDDISRHSVVKEWSAKLRLKHQLHDRGTYYDLELLALPKAPGIVIKYTTDGSAPTSATAATYAGPFKVPAGTRVVLAIATCAAFNLSSAQSNIPIPDGKKKPKINVAIPTKWKKKLKLDDSASVWKFIGKLEQLPNVNANDISVSLESSDGKENIDYIGSRSFEGASLKETVEKLQTMVEGGGLRMSVGSLDFPTGQGLLDWLKVSEISFEPNYVEQ